MIDDKKMGNLFSDKDFRKLLDTMAEHIVLDIANDVKYGNLSPEEEIVKSTLLLCLQSYSFSLLKALNFAWNSEIDVESFGAVNQYIDKLHTLFFEAEQVKMKEYEKRF